MKKTVYTIRRSEFHRKSISSSISDIATGFTTYDAALRRLCRKAASFGGKVEKDERGMDIVRLSDGQTEVRYWIFGATEGLGEAAPNILH